MSPAQGLITIMSQNKGCTVDVNNSRFLHRMKEYILSLWALHSLIHPRKPDIRCGWWMGLNICMLDLNNRHMDDLWYFSISGNKFPDGKLNTALHMVPANTTGYSAAFLLIVNDHKLWEIKYLWNRKGPFSWSTVNGLNRIELNENPRDSDWRHRCCFQRSSERARCEWQPKVCLTHN